MATIKTQASKQRPADGMVQLLARIDITRTNRPRLKTGIWAMPHHFVDGSIKIPRSGKLNTADVELAKDTARLLAAYIARVDNILAVSKSHVDTIEKEWLENVIELDKAGRIERVAGENPFIWSNIEKAINSTAKIAKAANDGMADIYGQIKTYCSEKQISASRQVAYYALARTIYRYTQFVRQTDSKRKKFVFDIAKLNSDDITAFIDYARNEGDLAEEYPKIFATIKEDANNMMGKTKVNRAHLSARNRSNNSLVILFSMLRTIIKWLRDEKHLTTNDPLSGVKISQEKYIEHPIFLTIEERDKFAEADFGNRPALDLTRDIFILQCLTGCRYNDLASLTSSNIYKRNKINETTGEAEDVFYLTLIPLCYSNSTPK